VKYRDATSTQSSIGSSSEILTARLGRCRNDDAHPDPRLIPGLFKAVEPIPPDRAYQRLDFSAEICLIC
jgi:hypothetical protein